MDPQPVVPVEKGKGKRASDAPDGPAQAKKPKADHSISDESRFYSKLTFADDGLIKQSDIFCSPVPIWSPRDKHGDPQQPRTWHYIPEWSRDDMNQLPKDVILSNIVAWMVWNSNVYTPFELAKYWPLDFRTKHNQAVLASGRLPRGRSQIFNCDWTKLPVWKHGAVVMTRVHSNPCWADPGYSHDDPVIITTVWPDASFICKFEDNIVGLFSYAQKKQALSVSVTSDLPKLDNDTLFVTVVSPIITPNPELLACFPNNGRFLNEIKRSDMQNLDKSSAVLCENIGSKFGAADVLILPYDQDLDSSASLFHHRVAKYLPIALTSACIAARRRWFSAGCSMCLPTDTMEGAVKQLEG
ncbi:hypothetical protein BKA80DRAFT_321987 [Phyllosticta citrichinensis]